MTESSQGPREPLGSNDSANLSIKETLLQHLITSVAFSKNKNLNDTQNCNAFFFYLNSSYKCLFVQEMSFVRTKHVH